MASPWSPTGFWARWLTADEILNEVTGQEIDMDACAQLTRETLS